MRRGVVAWWVFLAAVVLGLAVMLFFTVKILGFEQSMADAEAQAALEENIRLALWRMDSVVPLIQGAPTGERSVGDNTNSIEQQSTPAQRFDPAFQQALSSNERNLREQFAPAPAADWQKMTPVLLDRIKDILPGATLEGVTPDSNNPSDTRRLATIPARLVVPASALVSTALPWNTPVRISLMAAWACAVIAAISLGRLLAATLSLSERRGAFASAVTHELRTPLTTFRMYAEMLAGGMVADEPTRKQYLDTLVTESDRLGHLIENVLAYSRLENRLAPRRAAAAVSIERLIQHSLPALRRRADQAGLPLNVSLAENAAGVFCQTDPIAVGQVLINLVDNACKYGGTRIDLTARNNQGFVEISVSDRGPGLAPDRVKQLFQPFGKAKTDTVPGIGLGLFVSRQLARDLGGDLEYRPLQPGSMFVLKLPAE